MVSIGPSVGVHLAGWKGNPAHRWPAARSSPCWTARRSGTWSSTCTPTTSLCRLSECRCISGSASGAWRSCSGTGSTRRIRTPGSITACARTRARAGGIATAIPRPSAMSTTGRPPNGPRTSWPPGWTGAGPPTACGTNCSPSTATKGPNTATDSVWRGSTSATPAPASPISAGRARTPYGSACMPGRWFFLSPGTAPLRARPGPPRRGSGPCPARTHRPRQPPPQRWPHRLLEHRRPQCLRGHDPGPALQGRPAPVPRDPPRLPDRAAGRKRGRSPPAQGRVHLRRLHRPRGHSPRAHRPVLAARQCPRDLASHRVRRPGPGRDSP